jgi:hypothetical protein
MVIDLCVCEYNTWVGTKGCVAPRVCINKRLVLIQAVHFICLKTVWCVCFHMFVTIYLASQSMPPA